MPDLKPFEERSAEHLRLVIESAHIGIWELDVASGHAWRNHAHDEIFGYSEAPEEWTYKMFLGHVVESDRQRVDDLQQRAIRNNELWKFECEIQTAKDERRWISAAGRPLIGPDGSVDRLIGHVIDITDTKEREDRLSLLTNELNHRVRNMLGIIQSIVRLSAAKARDIPTFARSLEGRVDALARSHQLLISEAPGSMTVRAIVEQSLAAFPGLQERVKIEGCDEALLSGSTAQGLALVLHELITNAIKYGAFSNESGTVTTAITREDEVLRVVWREQGGPEVREAKQDGFGSRLISGALGRSGEVNLRFPADGAVCEIMLKLD